MKMLVSSRCRVSAADRAPRARGAYRWNGNCWGWTRSARLLAVLVGAGLLLVVSANGAHAQGGARGTNAATGTAPSVPGATNQTVPGPVRAPDYAQFRVIVERNIFAARRSGRVTGRGTAGRQTSAPRRTEYFVLVGTLEYGQKKVAFFDGSDPGYRKAVREGETLAGFRLDSVGYKSVRLEASNNVVELQVGWSMRKNAADEWELSREIADAGGRREVISTASGGSVGVNTQSAQASGAASDVLRRLMERREQEMQ